MTWLGLFREIKIWLAIAIYVTTLIPTAPDDIDYQLDMLEHTDNIPRFV